MARINSKGQIQGSVGPITYHSYNEKTYIQSKPGRGNMKQTAATKQSASDFGRASKLAKAIRGSLFPILQDHADNAFYRRLTAKVNAATQAGNTQPKGSRLLTGGDLTLLKNIDCNAGSPFSITSTLSPTLVLIPTRELTLSLEAFDLRAAIASPSFATDAELVFLVTTIDPISHTETHAELFRLALPLKDGIILAHEFTTAPLPAAQLVIVASAVFYYHKNNLAGRIPLNGKTSHPCEITAVLQT